MAHDESSPSSSELPSFADLGIPAAINETLLALGYENPTPIQQQAIPILLSGSDLLGQAQTGTGKTAAFALPLLANLDLKKRVPQILVLTPTRELTIQVAEAFQSYARALPGFNVIPIYGGQSLGTQLRQLERGPQVIVGTPGRVMDHLRRKSLRLETLRAVVLDEADEMLNMGFVEDIEWILEQSPKEKQIALFSATMPEQIRRVANTYLRNQKEVKIKTKTSTVETIHQQYWLVSGLHKLDALTRVLEIEDYDACLIFARTKTGTMELAEKLEARGHSCAALNGDLSQELRERTIQSMKKGQLDIIVATDVAARGLDVERISHVINYDIPYDPEAYVHRIGRTGRAGRSGKAILFVSPRERRMLTAIERATKQPIEPFVLPSKKDVSDKRIERFKKEITELLGSAPDLSFYAPIVEDIKKQAEVSELDLASALCYLLQKEAPFIVEETEVKNRDRGPARGESNDRFSRERPRREARYDAVYDDSNKVSYRIEVGRNHNVKPSNIVGAIANSGGIEGREIGNIEIHDDFSFVDLPRDLPEHVLSKLEGTHVLDRRMNIAKFEGEKPLKTKSFSRGPRRDRDSGGRERSWQGESKNPFEKPSKRKKFASDESPSKEKKSFGSKKTFGDKSKPGGRGDSYPKKFGGAGGKKGPRGKNKNFGARD